MFEKLIRNWLKVYIDDKLIRNQGGFRPGRSYTGQVQDLTQHIENGFEEKKITGVTFIDMSAAYDTINHNILFSKLQKLTTDNKLV